MKGKTIAIVNQKGGVGKTATTFNLGTSLAADGKKVLLIDLDQQGDLTYCLGYEEPDDLDGTIAELMEVYLDYDSYDPDVIDKYISKNDYGSEEFGYSIDYFTCNCEMSAVETGLVNAVSREYILKNLISEVKNNYDYILLDCAPSLGMITINALVAADTVLIPLCAKKLSSKGLNLLVKNILRVKKRLNPNLDIEGILFVAVDDSYVSNKGIKKEVMSKFGELVNIYDFSIPRLDEVEKSITAMTPIREYKDKKIKKGESIVAKLYDRLAKEVIGNEG
ncbi:MAG: ParA family protein [Lachnospiraceae bacterium]